VKHLLVAALISVSCGPPAPVTDPSIGPLSNAPEIACTSPAIPPLVAQLQGLGSQWAAVATAATAAGQTVGCCAYAQDLNTYLSQIPSPRDNLDAYNLFAAYRAASCGSACMRVTAGCL
jgi:hypothetical protein